METSANSLDNMTSCSSSTVPPFKYDVFISFSGQDTRNTFTSHLLAALQRASIKAHRDYEDLKRGDQISPALKEAIEMSKLFVIIFSEKYASSSWCLDELVHILECQENYKRSVLPVFYCVDPSDVQHQRRSFAINEERFGTNKYMGKFDKWRDALKAAANEAGWDSQVIRPEANLVERIVKDIQSKINQTTSIEYDVFISFQDEDTGTNFTSHLLAALQRASIKAYRDDADLKRGDQISPVLKEAIEMSKLYVIIFSEKYASSSWCLDELVHILEYQENYKRSVLPVFYCVDPSDVRHQRGSFAIKEERFGTNKYMDKFQKWRDALKAAANQAGWDSLAIGPEATLVERIVEDILSKINQTTSIDTFKGLVGITKRAAKIESLLQISSSTVKQKVGIWGIGGIGKTTLAGVVFDRLSNKFESSCFLQNIREEWGKGRENDLKKKLLSELLKEKTPNMGTLSLGPTYDKARLCSRKVLVVFDDVDDLKQLEFLSEDYSLFSPESRIIITTRDQQVLRKEVDEIYQVERLNKEEALVLFHSKAYKRVAPRKDLLHVSESVINYCEGIPLALEVLGSFFSGKKEDNWEEELDKLKKYLHPKIQSILKISFDGLDREQQRIFQDIACFFKGARRDHVERILGACGLAAKSGIEDLIDKSLITIKDDKIIWMHELVQEMGWENEQSIEELAKRRRLYNPEDVYHVLKNEIGTATIEGIFLDMSIISEVHFNPAAFRNMYGLRLLKFFYSNRRKKCKLCISDRDNQDLQFLPDALRYLHWEEYPWKSFPSSFRPLHLVELNLPRSKVHKLWEGKQDLGILKKIDLGYSEHLIELPDLSRAKKLEHVYLEYCTSLEEVPSYFQHLNNLITLVLEGCSSMREFPKLSKSIVCLVLSGTAIERVPSSIEHLSSLEILNLNHCKNLMSLPHISKFTMKNLKAVTLEGAGFMSWRNYQRLPWWIADVVAHSQLSLYERTRSRTRVFQLCPLLKVESVPRLPLFAIHIGNDMYVETVLISMKHLDTEIERGPAEFLFYNCVQLYGSERNDNLVRSRLGVLSSKIASHEFPTLGELPAEVYIGLCRPGRDIPKWFLYQSSPITSSRTNILSVVMDLPPNSINPNFLGFAVCVAAKIDRFKVWRPKVLQLLCKPLFIMNNGCTLSWDFTYISGSDNHLNGRVLIEEERLSTLREMITKVEFVFLLCDHFRSRSLDFRTYVIYERYFGLEDYDTFHYGHAIYELDIGLIIQCAIRPLYEEDAKNFGLLDQQVSALEKVENCETSEEFRAQRK